MKRYVLSAMALAAASLVSAPAFAQAKEGPWMVRARVVSLASANADSTPLNLSVNDIVLPEVDFSYFFTAHIAAELILTVPQQHDLKASGSKIGTITHLPPTLLLQYHFDAFGVKPYVGAGVNFTKFTNYDLPAGVTIDSSSTGAALQVGVDVPLSSGLYLNFDVKKVLIGTNVYSNGTSLGNFKVDPLLVGVGVGWRF